MIIGNFSYDPGIDTYSGDMITLTCHRTDVQIRPSRKRSTRGPDYRIIAVTPLGEVEFGAAWKRLTERGERYLSVSMDDPALPTALNAALFTENSGGRATMVWSRQRPREQSNDAVEGER